MIKSQLAAGMVAEAMNMHLEFCGILYINHRRHPIKIKNQPLSRKSKEAFDWLKMNLLGSGGDFCVLPVFSCNCPTFLVHFHRFRNSGDAKSRNLQGGLS